MFPPSVPSVEPGGVPEGAALLDVREQDEWDAGHAAGAVHIPLGDLPSRFAELDPSDEIVLQCRSGARSARALAFLRQQGYEKVLNLKGGILAWSDEVDPSVPKY